jgi:hypothetical protein
MPSALRDNLFAAYRRSDPQAMPPYLPVMLDATEGTWARWLGIVAAAAVLLVGLLNLRQGVARLRDPALHPSMRALAAYGPLRANVAAIDADVAGGSALTVKATTLTSSWLITRAAFAVHMVPLTEVVWFYKHVTKHYTNFIPTGKTYAVHLHDRRGREVHIPASRKNVDGLLTELHRRAPWAIAGWTPEIAQAMRGPQRSQVVREVDERRKAARPAA